MLSSARHAFSPRRRRKREREGGRTYPRRILFDGGGNLIRDSLTATTRASADTTCFVRFTHTRISDYFIQHAANDIVYSIPALQQVQHHNKLPPALFNITAISLPMDTIITSISVFYSTFVVKPTFRLRQTQVQPQQRPQRPSRAFPQAPNRPS